MEVKCSIASPSMRQRIVSIFLAKPMRSWFRCKRRQIVTIHGFIGKPEFAKKNRGEQFFFVNDRFIKAVCIMRLWPYDGLYETAQPSYFFILDGAAQYD
jgi:DNA mismatch repair protein MutL